MQLQLTLPDCVTVKPCFAFRLSSARFIPYSGDNTTNQTGHLHILKLLFVLIILSIKPEKNKLSTWVSFFTAAASTRSLIMKRQGFSNDNLDTPVYSGS